MAETHPRNDPFARRIGEQRVARVLELIATQPNRRSDPQADDLPGDFHFWFDGGAGWEFTGDQRYTLADGTEVYMIYPVPWLAVSIKFPNGEVVTVEQESPPTS